MRTIKSQTLSLVLHLVSISFLLFLTSRSIQSSRAVELEAIPLVLPRDLAAVRHVQQHSGGSNRTLRPAEHGSPPPRAHRTFTPPVFRPDPKLAIPITIAYESPTIEIDAPQLGDTSSNLLVGALGHNGLNGMGDDRGGRRGIGPGGSGPPGISSNPTGHNITRPQLIYQVEPEFSEEARKAKYSGVVVLGIDVDTNGRPSNLRVLQSLGLGLDERAIDAVLQWRFRPGTRDGRPFVTAATVQVTFRLL
jgi:protein TonB